MAAYFNGVTNSDIQPQQPSSAADSLQTLMFMNPNYTNNTHHNPNNNFVFFNSTMSHSQIPTSASSEHTHQLVGIPLHQTHHHETISPLHGLIPRPQYNLWTPVEASTAAHGTPRAQQGLSLSLSNSQQQRPLVGFDGSVHMQPLQQAPSSGISPSGSKDDGIETPSPGSVISKVPTSGMKSVLMSSKYLKATQQLLEEVVNVGSATPITDSAKKKDTKISNKAVGTSSERAATEAGDGENDASKVSVELSTAENQEIQMKKGKLVCILNEVEQRYRQYHHQMQTVIATFEQAAGQGSAKTYTALALRTISRQFRCLKDAIMTQIKAVNKVLGEEDIGGKEGGSRLKFVDHHLRQQRALQQLGMIQHNAWRPQRGLPEISVSVLRAWLFEHFLHPYPKDSDKHMLAKKTGLTRSQVSNWFINARVRLWKPMVEEMYNEELKDQENEGPVDKMWNNGKASTSKVPNEENQNLSFKHASQEAYQKEAAILTNNQTTGFSLIGSSELEGITEMHPKRQRMNDQMLHHHHHGHPTGNFQSAMEMNSNEASNEHVLVKFGIERQPRDDYSLMAAGPTNFIGGFGSYPMEEIGRFDTNQYNQPRFSGNGVSLTLGLNDTPRSFLPNQSSSEWTLSRQLNSVP